MFSIKEGASKGQHLGPTFLNPLASHGLCPRAGPSSSFSSGTELYSGLSAQVQAEGQSGGTPTSGAAISTPQQPIHHQAGRAFL